MIQIAIMLSIISSHFNKLFFAFNPKKAPNNGNKNIKRIYGLPNAPNDTPFHIVKNITTKITKVVSERTLYLLIWVHLPKSWFLFLIYHIQTFIQ